ncbi:ChuX-like family protein [Planctomycetes bacterium Pan216]|uniref:ChuX-like family protein n=1 Tax=Kolteria novifilia TaxID=2527975 RepID=A0A518AZ93_9BACT|nr:ChuX-like family protein [Planctomycetes bacterium Pan216]
MGEDEKKQIAEMVREAFEHNPRQMTPHVADSLGITECEVVRYLPDGRSVELDLGSWEEVFRSFEPLGDVFVIVNTGTVAIEAEGTFGGFSKSGPYFNVQSGSLDMHIRYDRLGAIFAVEKPSHMDGVSTLSFQFFEKTGRSAFKVFLSFGGSAPAPERRQLFDDLRERFGLKGLV